jgi:ABC-type nitrate/sulfonate/bicarbonate transport system permease component
MPHIHRILGALFEPSRANGPLLISVLARSALFTAKEAAAGFALGGAILNFNQYYSIEPQELWATNIVAAILGIVFFVAVVAAEKAVVRRAPEVTT